MNYKFLVLSFGLISLLSEGALGDKNSLAFTAKDNQVKQSTMPNLSEKEIAAQMETTVSVPSEPPLAPSASQESNVAINEVPGPGVATVLPEKKGFEKSTLIAAKKKKKKSKVSLSARRKKSTIANASSKSSAGL